MSLFENARRAFSSDADYDAEDSTYATDEDYGYDDQDEGTEKHENAIKKFFAFIFGFDKDEEDMDSYETEREERETRDRKESARSRYDTKFTRTSDRDYYSSHTDTTGNNIEIITMYPENVDDASKIVRELKMNKIVLFDVNDQVKSADEAQRIVDYVGGAAEGLDCPFSRMCASVFCIAPKGVKFKNTKTGYKK